MMPKKNILLVLLGVCALILGGGVAPTKTVDPQTLAKKIRDQKRGLKSKVLDLALRAAVSAEKRGLSNKQILTVVDYSLPSTKKRLWVIDLKTGAVLFHELVAHGKGSGDNWPKKFSNQPQSLTSSLGLYRTMGTYEGKHGYSLKLEGLEKGFNDKAEERAIVIHEAWYVSQAFAKKHGRLGRSWGCPALDKRVARKVIDTIKDGSLLFIYHPDKTWLSGSKFLKTAN